MKILFDSQVFSFQRYGGISRYFFEIANHIAGNKENKVEIFSPLFINEYLLNCRNVRIRGFKSPRIHNFEIPVKFILNGNQLLSRFLTKPRQNVDIFHETYYSMFDVCPRSAKRIITVYDMVHEKFPEPGSGCSKITKAKIASLQRVDHIICISENTRQDLIKLLDIPEKKTSVVHLGHSLILKNNKAKLSIEKKPFILYVGPRVGYKNFEGLLRAYGNSHFLKSEFSLACFGGENFNSRELLLIEALKIPLEKVKYFSGTDDVLAGLYASAAAFVYPSLYEGFGIPPLESMSFGCPVVCSNTSSMPEVVGNAAEFFDPNDESEIRLAIERVLSSAERRQMLVNAGFERIKQFSWKKCALETLDVYKRVLNDSQS
ncbi:MAG: glycosyltransferase family 4 protein [Candidatus Riflebacteria bacterium]|nr:glycosyltransferase family 4 protein [Candidatus Riflebacteria bacterium]